MKIGLKREFRGRKAKPDYKDSSKMIYFVLLEDIEEISSKEYFVSQEVYNSCSVLKRGQAVNVEFDFIETPKYTGMRVVAVKAVA